MRGKNRARINEAFSNSRICRLFMKISNYLCAKAESSIAGKIFSSYNDGSDGGLIGGLFKKADLPRRFFRPVKRVVSRSFSNSVLLKLADTYLKRFLYTGLNMYGLFFITSGIGFFLVQMLKGYVLGGQYMSFLDVSVSALLVLVSLPMLFSDTRLSEAVCRSKFASAVVLEWLGCSRETFEGGDGYSGHVKLPIPAALMLCIASWWTRPFLIVITIIVFVYMIAVLYTPETGIVGLLLVIPFVSAVNTASLILFTFISFGLKYIRGKRTVRFDTLGVSVLMLFVVMLFSGLGRYGLKNALYTCCCIGAFFLTVNLIKSKKWISRCVRSVILSCLFVSVYGVLRYFASNFGIGYLISLMRSGENEKMLSLFGSETVFASYLSVVILFNFVGMKSEKKIRRIISFVSFLSAFACVFFTFEYRVWLSLVFGGFMFMILYGRKTLAVTVASLCCLPFVVINLPRSVNGTVLGYFSDMARGLVAQGSADKITLIGSGVGAYNLYGEPYGMWEKMLNELGIVGVVLFFVILFFCVQKNMTMHSRGCSEKGKLLSIASTSSVIAFALAGAGVNVFESFGVSVTFWLCLGIASSVSVIERSNMIASDEIY